MTEERWRELLRRYPGRCIYREFNPDRIQEPWKPTARDWRRPDTRRATFTTIVEPWSER